MKRLRHPIRAIREPFGTAGLIVACVALIAAVGGTALAATKLNSTQKKEVEKIAKKFAGKPGAPGAKGDAGAPGAKGDAGAAGTSGAKGDKGDSVTGAPIAANGVCGKKTGVKYTLSGTPTNVCSGEDGVVGDNLSPGKTEPGTWSAGGFSAEFTNAIMDTISFNIPLAAPSDKVVYLTKTQTEGSTGTPVEGCKYDPTNPVVAAGTLCVFTTLENGEGGKVTSVTKGTTFESVKSDSRFGAYIYGEPSALLEELGIGKFEIGGTWAVTAK